MSTGSEHRQRSSCLSLSIILSTPRYIVQGDTGSHGRNPALTIPFSRRPRAPEKKTTLKGWICRTVCLKSASLPHWHTYVQWLVYPYGSEANHTIAVHIPVFSSSFTSLTLFLLMLNSKWWKDNNLNREFKFPKNSFSVESTFERPKLVLSPLGKVCQCLHLL